MVSNLTRERNMEKKLRTQESLVMLPTSSEKESSTLKASAIQNSSTVSILSEADICFCSDDFEEFSLEVSVK